MTSLRAVTSPDFPHRSSGDRGVDDATGPVLILLHGYGSHEHDLAGLAPMLPAGVPWASLRAPLDMGYGAAAWFPLALEREDPASVATAADLDLASSAIWEWIDAKVPAATPLVPLGFSQGGCMALQMLRTRPDRVRATVVLSGFAAPAAQVADDALARSRPVVFSGRGDADAVIPRTQVAALDAWLDDHASAERHVYRGLAHSINEQEMRDVEEFLDQHDVHRMS